MRTWLFTRSLFRSARGTAAALLSQNVLSPDCLEAGRRQMSVVDVLHGRRAFLHFAIPDECRFSLGGRAAWR
jgi:hypothetical protein